MRKERGMIDVGREVRDPIDQEGPLRLVNDGLCGGVKGGPVQSERQRWYGGELVVHSVALLLHHRPDPLKEEWTRHFPLLVGFRPRLNRHRHLLAQPTGVQCLVQCLYQSLVNSSTLFRHRQHGPVQWQSDR